ncbi:MAG: hypothetical protein IJR08_04925 [Bacilli bacterium]|nr:hypothetical protein [Bacilli bacterium]
MPSTLVIFIVIIAATAVVALLAFILYRILRPRLKEEKPSDEQILEDEMKRVLQDVEDEEVAKQISNYKDDE